MGGYHNTVAGERGEAVVASRIDEVATKEGGREIICANNAAAVGDSRNTITSSGAAAVAGHKRGAGVVGRENAVSGDNAAEPCNVSGAAYLGKDELMFSSSIENTAAECQELSRQHSECNYFNYYYSGLCNLTTGTAGTMVQTAHNVKASPPFYATLVSGGRDCALTIPASKICACAKSKAGRSSVSPLSATL